MGEVLFTQGVIIHSRTDWPCVRCRPRVWGGRATTSLLCVACADAITRASIQRIVCDGVDGPDDLPSAPAPECDADGPNVLSNWFLPGFWSFK